MASGGHFGSLRQRNGAFYEAIAFFLIFCSLCSWVGAASKANSMYYVCPPKFVRLGSSCYYFSAMVGTWQQAHFSCKDLESNLTAPQRWEDRNLRQYLNRPEISKVERWIGGIYDWEAQSWKWGGEMRLMRYQSFSRMEKKTPEELKWHCIAMDPVILYRWAPRNCVNPKHYICQTPLRKVRKNERNQPRQRTKTPEEDEPNEISAPKMEENEINRPDRDDNEIIPFAPYGPKNLRSRPAVEINYNGGETFEYAANSVAPDPVNRRGRTDTAFARRPLGRRRMPFKGFMRNKNNPEEAYRHNVAALKSGKTGLSSGEVEKHMRRLERMRKRYEARRRNQKREGEGIVRNNTTVLIGKKRDRNEKAGNKLVLQLRSLSHRRRGGRRGKAHTLDKVTQRTITVENALSASSELHPKLIMEIHDFKA